MRSKSEIIKSNLDQLEKYFYYLDKYGNPNQCVNLFNFPDNFS